MLLTDEWVFTQSSHQLLSLNNSFIQFNINPEYLTCSLIIYGHFLHVPRVLPVRGGCVGLVESPRLSSRTRLWGKTQMPTKSSDLGMQKNKIFLLRSFSFPPASTAWTCPELREGEQHFGIRHQLSTWVLKWLVFHLKMFSKYFTIFLIPSVYVFSTSLFFYYSASSSLCFYFFSFYFCIKVDGKKQIKCKVKGGKQRKPKKCEELKKKTQPYQIHVWTVKWALTLRMSVNIGICNNLKISIFYSLCFRGRISSMLKKCNFFNTLYECNSGASSKFLMLDSGRRAELLPLASGVVCSVAEPLYLKGVSFHI